MRSFSFLRFSLVLLGYPLFSQKQVILADSQVGQGAHRRDFEIGHSGSQLTSGGSLSLATIDPHGRDSQLVCRGYIVIKALSDMQQMPFFNAQAL